MSENVLQRMRDEREGERFPGYAAGGTVPYLKAAVRAVGRHFVEGITGPLESTLGAARSGAYGLRVPGGGLYTYYDPSAPLQVAMEGIVGGAPGIPKKVPGTVDVGLLGGAGRAAKRPRGLGRAEELLKKGADVEDIWQGTGWIRGKEGKWRFEIDDSGLKY